MKIIYTFVEYVISAIIREGEIFLPIDPDFQKKMKKVGRTEGVAVWGPVNPPEKLGVRGTYVAVDWDVCSGCGVCLTVCPMQLYDWRETTGYPTSEKKAFPARESECVNCYKCETQCPAQAIRVVFSRAKNLYGGLVNARTNHRWRYLWGFIWAEFRSQHCMHAYA